MGAAEPQDVKSRIRLWCQDAGFDDCGFTTADEVQGSAKALAEFLNAGHHADMAWLQDRSEQRIAVSALWPEARSVVVCMVNYAPEADPRLLQDKPTIGAISVYARNKDYHDVVKKRLKQVARRIHGELSADVKVFVDTAPVMEKPLAQRAGLGWVGKHSNIVSRSFGSWTFLGIIATTLELAEDTSHPDRCGRCTRCMDVCPTGAIVAAGQVDARLCISYLTIENKEHIPHDLRPQIGNRIYGCDDCLAVCPWNRFAKVGREAKLQARDDLQEPELLPFLDLDDAGFRQLFSGSPIKRIGRDRFLRNVLIAVGNGQLQAALPKLKDLIRDDSPLVRAAAVWALGQVGTTQDILNCQAYTVATEDDPAVQKEWQIVLNASRRGHA